MQKLSLRKNLQVVILNVSVHVSVSGERKCVIKQRSEYVINRYVINPAGGGKKTLKKKRKKKKEARTSSDGAVWVL